VAPVAVGGRYLTPVSKLVLPRGLPVLVDLDDVCYRFDPSLGWSGPLVGARVKSWLKQSAAASAAARFDSFFFASELDRQRFPALSGTVLPNIPFRAPAAPSFATHGATVLFVGSLWYAPNRAGVERFLARSWPRVQAARRDARLVLVGAAPAADRARWSAQAGVSAPGHVADLDAAYRDAALCVAPVWCGGGTNIKVLEAFARGRACVTTRFALRAFDGVFDAAADLAVADGDDAFAAAVLHLLARPDEREARARRGHAIVRTVFSPARFAAVVRTAVTGVSAAAPA
jgi:glycosyltransferase involved in cell wall biosynthesis